MKANWRLWLGAVGNWAFVIAGFVILINFGRFRWYDIAFLGTTELLLLVLAVLFTVALIHEIRENTDKKRAERQAKIEARLKELEKYDENQLLGVLTEFGYQDQFSSLIEATKEGRLHWRGPGVYDDEDDENYVEAGEVVFGTHMYKIYTPEEIKNGSRQWLMLETWVKEVSGVYSLNFQSVTVFSDVVSYEYCQNPVERGDKRVKELFDYVMQKCGKRK